MLESILNPVEKDVLIDVCNNVPNFDEGNGAEKRLRENSDEDGLDDDMSAF